MRGIAASFVITGELAQPPLARGGVVLDDDERVIAVGQSAALRQRYPSARWEQLRAVLTPGLVNAHTHLELSALRARVPGGRGFGAWVAELVEQRAQPSAGEVEEAIDTAVSELLAAGTVAVGEVTNSLAGVPALESAPLLGRIFHEVFGVRREAGELMLGMAERQRAAIKSWPRNLSYVPAPHTPFTLHPAIFSELLRRARSLGARTSLHLCEHAAERAYLADGSGAFADFLRSHNSGPADWPPPGLDPVRYAHEQGALAKDVICVHLCDARPDEIALVAAARTPVVLCPRSNLHIEVRLPPLLELLQAGIRPALGTDSLASCASLDVLEDARALAERFPSVAPRTLIAMATSFGAEALGLERRLGRLAVGLTPGVIAFEHHDNPPDDPERFVLSRAGNQRRVLARVGKSPCIEEAA